MGFGFGFGWSAAIGDAGGAAGLVPFSADFVNGAYVIDGGASDFATATDFTRASAGWADNLAGTWSSFATNVARITNKGILIEPASTNLIRNPDMAGSDPALEWFPQYWSTYAGGGLSLTVEATGSAIGFTYLRFRLQGVASGSDGMLIFFEANNQITAAQWETFVASCFMRLHAGGTSTITNLRFNLWENNAAGGNLNISYGTQIKDAISSSWQRFEYAAQLSQALTAFVQPALEVSFTGGAAVDLTIDLVMPQLEKRSVATSPIDGSRSADALVLNLPAGTHDLRYTFDDTTTQTIPDVAGGGTYAVPTNLDRPRVTRIDWGSV